jgi:hypothetical protein
MVAIDFDDFPTATLGDTLKFGLLVRGGLSVGRNANVKSDALMPRMHPLFLQVLSVAFAGQF